MPCRLAKDRPTQICRAGYDFSTRLPATNHVPGCFETSRRLFLPLPVIRLFGVNGRIAFTGSGRQVSFSCQSSQIKHRRGHLPPDGSFQRLDSKARNSMVHIHAAVVFSETDHDKTSPHAQTITACTDMSRVAGLIQCQYQSLGLPITSGSDRDGIPPVLEGRPILECPRTIRTVVAGQSRTFGLSEWRVGSAPSTFHPGNSDRRRSHLTFYMHTFCLGAP